MKILYSLSTLIIASVAVQLPNGPGANSPVTFVVVPRNGGHYYENDRSVTENRFSQLYQERIPSPIPASSAKTKQVIKLDDRFRNAYAIPRRQLNHRQTYDAPVQFLKEVTPTTVTAFEEQQQHQELPDYRYTETETSADAVVQRERQDEFEEVNKSPFVEDQNQIRSLLFVRPDLIKQPQELVQYKDPNQNDFASINPSRFSKPDTQKKTMIIDNQRLQAFAPRAIKDVDESFPAQTRRILVFRQDNPPRVLFGNGQTYNSRYLGYLPQLIKEFPFGYRLQLEDPQVVPVLPYANQAHWHSKITRENKSDVKLTNRKYRPRPGNTIPERNASEENVNPRINYDPHFDRYKLYPTYPKNNQRTVQILQEEDE
ncbi:hypothetical protein FQR65_LT04181 [Abscondita terminalis]|nr:hypothetical protein FQR65_LT04181 [Abscondita terminalis]